jgi:glycosyltransferase involved in cell wall biosynthesis
VNAPKVSVIVPVYNPGKYLCQCLDTIISQTLKEIEIICVDDGSTDGSAEVLAQYQQKDNRIRIVTQENKGGGPARNTGLEIARGEYLSFLDSDDYFDKDMLRLASKKADETDADVVIFNIYTDDFATGIIKMPTWALEQEYIPHIEVFSKDDIPETILQLSAGSVWNKLYRREMIIKENIRFQNIAAADDIYFSFMALVLAKRVTVLNKRLMYYRASNPTGQIHSRTKVPLNQYIALKTVKEALCDRNLYYMLEKTFLNRAADMIINSLYAMKTCRAFELLYNCIRTEIFSNFKFDQKEKEFFYNEGCYESIHKIKQYTAAEYLFERIENLRHAFNCWKGFIFPYSRVRKNERIILYGAGEVGQTFYNQIKNSRCCRLVLWVDKNYKNLGPPVKSPDTIMKTNFDKVIIAVLDKGVADSIRDYLKSMNVDDDRIIWVDSRLV